MRAYAYPLAVAAIWGLAYPLTKYLVAYFSPGFIAFFRALVGFLFLSAISRPVKIDGRTAIAGVLNMGATVLLINLSVMLSNSPGLVSHVHPASIPYSPFSHGPEDAGKAQRDPRRGPRSTRRGDLGGWRRRRPLRPIAHTRRLYLGVGHGVYSKWLAGRPPTSTTAAMNGAAAFLLPFAALAYRSSFTVKAALLLTALAVLAQGAAWLLWFRSVRELGPVKVGELSLLVPVFSYLFSYLAFGAVPAADQVVGSALILLGILAVYIGTAKLK